MKITTSKGQETWSSPGQQDLERHTLVFRLLKLGETLLDSALDDAEVRSRYDAERAARGWSSDIPLTPLTEEEIVEQMVPLIGFPLGDDGDPEKPRGVFMGALDGDQFMLMISAEEFYASAAFLYDLEEAHVLAGFVTGFSGRIADAITWLEDFESEYLPDLLFPDEDDGEDDDGEESPRA